MSAAAAAAEAPLVVVPGRLASARLPRKLLARLGGASLLEHALRGALTAAVGPVAAAVDGDELAEAARAAGVEATRTDPALPSGSDRAAAAAAALDPGRARARVIVLQGDMPFVPPRLLRALAAAAAASDADLLTPVAPLPPGAADDPARVKAAVELPAPEEALAPGAARAPGRALFFSRAPVPSGGGALWGHVGIYAWRRAALERFVSLPPSRLEAAERLEQLRALADGMRVEALPCEDMPDSVDEPRDLERLAAAGGAAP